MLSIRIALKYLFSHKSHSAVNIISYISIAGVAIASAAMVIVLSVFNGFALVTESKLSRLTPDFQVTSVDGRVIDNADSIASVIRNIGGVADAAPTVEQRAFAVADDRQMPLTIKGVASGSPSHKALSHIMIDGDTLLSSDGPVTTAISSVGVANTLRTLPSCPVYVRIYEPRRRGRINPSNPLAAFRSDSVIVAGVYRVEQAEYDADMLVIPLATSRRLLDYDKEATAVEVGLQPGADASSVGESISSALGEGYLVADRMRQHQQSFRMIEIEKWVTLLMLTFILVIASFNILSSMSMLIVDKRPNRAIMIALGATPGRVASVFAWLSFLITFIGALAGILLGVALSLAQQYGGFIKLNASDPSAMSIDVYPVDVTAADLLVVGIVVTAIGLVSALIVRLIARGD